jgi:hypothetical protein
LAKAGYFAVEAKAFFRLSRCLPISYLVSNPQENVNWVYGFGQKPQRILPAPLFVVLLMLLFPLAVYLPTHLLFTKMFRAAGS